MKAQLHGISFGYEIEPKGQTQPLFKQVHGTVIQNLDEVSEPAEADGGYTFQKKEVFVFTADCFPVLLFSLRPQTPLVALHAGWRGLRDGIVAKGLALFDDKTQIQAIIGPGIKSCCFEVKEDFLASFKERGRPTEKYLNEKMHFDLTRFIRETDLSILSDQQIYLNWHTCTYCTTPKLPSFRRNGQADPRLRTWIRNY